MDIDTIVKLLNLGYPALITLAFVVLARWYNDHVMSEIARQEARISALEAQLIECLKKQG